MHSQLKHERKRKPHGCQQCFFTMTYEGILSNGLAGEDQTIGEGIHGFFDELFETGTPVFRLEFLRISDTSAAAILEYR